MAGLWERIKPDALDRVPVHLIQSAIYCAGRGLFTDAQVRNALNAVLTTPLDSASETDLANIKAQAVIGSATLKIDYQLRLHAVCISAENGALNEATWRSELGIT